MDLAEIYEKFGLIKTIRKHELRACLPTIMKDYIFEP